VIIAKAGRPMVRVVPVDPLPASRRLGFMVGRGCIDADVKTSFADEIDTMFPR
jgi:antitoxin (DNA-binding transcriptional repressor) of toxin-antitoxin stability system